MEQPQDYSHLCGHIYDQATQEEVTDVCLQRFGDLPLESGVGKSRKLYLNPRKVLGEDWTEIQQIGDCTPHAVQRGYLMSFGTKIIVLGTGQTTIPKLATEPLYAYSRVEIMNNLWRGSDGTSTSACIKAAKKYGFLKRQKYPGYDFTRYDPSLARLWGDKGVPDDLDSSAEEDQLLAYYPSFDYGTARDLIYNGYAVMVSSNWGFKNARRDSRGRISPSGTWPHSMVYTAMDDDPSDPCLLLDNRSWPPNWVTGPKRDDEPDGTGWVRADDADKMLRGAWGSSRPMPDSYAISNTKAFPSQGQMLDQIEMF